MNNNKLPPLMPDDFAALAALAGPLYQESRTIESYTSDNPIPGAHKEYGSMNIKQQLEQAHRLAQASVARPTQQMYTPSPVPSPQPDYVNGAASHIPHSNFEAKTLPENKNDDSQLEFSFNPSKQDETNKLLGDISKKLTKIINLLEQEGVQKAPKLKNVKNQI